MRHACQAQNWLKQMQEADPTLDVRKHWNSVHSLGCNPQGKDLGSTLHLRDWDDLDDLVQCSRPIRVLRAVRRLCWEVGFRWLWMVSAHPGKHQSNSCHLKGSHSARRSHLCRCDQCSHKGQGLRKAVETRKPHQPTAVATST